jgi:6-pyruvoyl-tetrahydropterin synthase
VGESWIVDIVLGGELDEQGMVFDFSNVKRTIKRVIDERVDHRLVIPLGYPGLHREQGGSRAFSWTLSDGSTITHRSPDEAVVWLSADRVLPSAVSGLLQQELEAVLPGNVTDIDVQLREEVIEGAYYHYVHGLKKHLGNCQRIAHGHRSPIRIDRNGRRDRDLERRWAKQWEDIYIGSEEDVAARWVAEDGTPYIRFDYEANQGEFSLTLPEKRVHMLDSDTTLELIAAHIADRLMRDFPNDAITVKAYEGVGKGAMAVRGLS